MKRKGKSKRSWEKTHEERSKEVRRDEQSRTRYKCSRRLKKKKENEEVERTGMGCLKYLYVWRSPSERASPVKGIMKRQVTENLS